MNNNKKRITKRLENYSQWYLDIVEAADLAENSPVRGCMILKPWGYAIWENFQKILDNMIKSKGHANVYFPLFIPISFFEKEAEHVDGFAKESAVITHYRLLYDKTTKKLNIDPKSSLEEKLIVRPTSETIIYETFSRWIKSYRDLPLKINQWANVVRWEMRTRPFLRTSEFLWQEGHTAHSTFEEADKHARDMLDVYYEFFSNYLAIATIPGVKTENEKFAGAHKTYTLEAIMQDGKALQSCTSHNLSNNFAKAFNIKYINKNGVEEYVYQTSWGLSTRSIGALIMVHSDDNGLVLPPLVSPIQVIIIPIHTKNKDLNTKIIQECKNIKASLTSKNIKVEIDLRDCCTIGEKIYEWEKKGVPIRIEIGEREILENTYLITRRDNLHKEKMPKNEVIEKVESLIYEIQQYLYNKSKQFLKDNVIHASSYNELENIISSNKAGLIQWSGNAKFEKKIKNNLKSSIRCIPFNINEHQSEILKILKIETNNFALVAKAY